MHVNILITPWFFLITIMHDHKGNDEDETSGVFCLNGTKRLPKGPYVFVKLNSPEFILYIFAVYV